MSHRVVFDRDPRKQPPTAVVVDGKIYPLGRKGKLFVPVQPEGLITEIPSKLAVAVESSRRRD